MILTYKMHKKQYYKLQMIERRIQQCKDCDLHVNGRARPYFTSRSEYGIIGESPWKEEVAQNKCFVGQAGQLLWQELNSQGLPKEKFCVINSVNCKPRAFPNNKPTLDEIATCHKWIHIYFDVVRPKKILVLGNYAMCSVLGDPEGITGKVGDIEVFKSENFEVPIMLCVHPSYAIYNLERGMQQFREGIRQFAAM